jgi:CHAT domain-containing protein/tetratricopeptide (TPR) repeat protein
MSVGPFAAFLVASALAHAQSDPPRPATPVPARVGETALGEVTATSDEVHTETLDRSVAHDAVARGVRLVADLPAGATTIELHSDFFDAYLVVRDAAGAVLGEDDDGLIRTHARVALELDTAKRCELVACALHGGSGPFELTVRAGRSAPLAPAERREAEIADAKGELAAKEKRLGAETVAVAETLTRLATFHVNAGAYDEARRCYERALAIAEKVCGPEGEFTGAAVSNLGSLEFHAGRYEVARQLFERALAISEKTVGPDHPDTANSLDNLSTALATMGRRAESRPLCERALAIREKALGSDDPETARSLANLAVHLRAAGSYDKARQLYDRSLAIRERRLGPDHPDTASTLENMGSLAGAQGRYEEARVFYERALAIREKVFGPEHPETAAALENLAELMQDECRYDVARQFHERSLAIREKALGPEHPETITSVTGLATLLGELGRYEEARPLFERALAVSEKVFGPDHPWTSGRLNEYAMLLMRQGKLEEARPLFERALAIREKALGPDHPATAGLLANLAGLLEREGRRDEARSLEERVLAVREHTVGPDDLATATALNNLASNLVHAGELAKARPLHERALAIREKVFGEDDPDTGTSLDNLACLCRLEGRPEAALPLFERALAISRRVVGEEHPDTAATLGELFATHFDLGDLRHARESAEALLRSQRAHAFQEATRASEADVARLLAALNDGVAALLSSREPTQRAEDDVYGEVLFLKGDAFRVTSRRRREVAGRSDPKSRALLDRLQIVRAEMSSLFSQPVLDHEQHDADVARLRKEREECETALAAVVESQADFAGTSPAALRAALPADTVLLDFLEHRLYLPARSVKGRAAKPGDWSEPHFSVWISARGATSHVDLGPSAAIEAAIVDDLDALVGVRGAGAVASANDAAANAKAKAKRLRELVWQPIVAALPSGAFGVEWKHVVLSPDGAIATLPFGLIQEESGCFLLEELSFARVEDASSLARRAAAAPSLAGAPSLLVAGAVDYDADADGVRSPDPSGPAAIARGGRARTWIPLSETRRETDGVARLHRLRFADAPRTTLEEADATEARLKAELPKHQVVHLATHGYFVADAAPLETREQQLVAGYWPEFLCGVVCAGANRPRPGHDDGLLTGDEVGALDLGRCDLVVLSACETALGRRQSGEGLLSLARSFRLAGARTVISSLWQVRDDSTKELMLDFYDRLWTRREAKLEALRGAQLDMLRQNREKYGDARPATWAAFVLTGAVR